MAPRKVDFALAARAAVTTLAEAAERIAELNEVFVASGYNTGGSDPIIDSDIEGHDITAANLADVATFAENLYKFLNDDTPLKFDYATAINAFRGM